MKIKVFLKKIIPANIRKMLRNIQRVLGLIIKAIIFYLVKPFAFITRKFSKEKIYIFAERGIDAGDNGYYMYNYFKNKGHKCFYIIDKKCSDAKKIDTKDIISPKLSLKHYFLYQRACAFIYTHHSWYLPTLIREEKYFKLYGIKVFLKHGVIENKISLFPCNLFITASRYEQDFVIKQTLFDNKTVILTGLARFDDLFNNSKDERIILVMPTWRKWLHSKTKQEFLESDYYSKWKSLVNNEKLSAYCKMKGYKIVFYPHFEVRKLLGSSAFKLDEEQKNWNVHKLLLNCSLVVTDYSSVAFDVAYQMKPIIYYQFDYERFFGDHCGKGYYDYKKGLGYYSETEKGCVEHIIHALNNGLDVDLKQRIRDFFCAIDNHNCERIYNAIIEKQK